MAKEVFNDIGMTYLVDAVEMTPAFGWECTRTCKLSPRYDNENGVWEAQTEGGKKRSGTLSWFHNDSTGPPFSEGDRVLLQLQFTADSDDGGFLGYARIGEMRYSVDKKDGGNNIEGVATFESDGSWSELGLAAEDGSSSG